MAKTKITVVDRTVQQELIDKHAFAGEEKLPSKKLTISAGVASYPVDADSRQSLIEKADKALYTAKTLGRNRVSVFGRDEE